MFLKWTNNIIGLMFKFIFSFLKYDDVIQLQVIPL